MAYLSIDNVKVRGLSSAVPKNIEFNKELNDLFVAEEMDKFVFTTGVESRRIASNGICTSDLCFSAASQLLSDLNWNTEDVECLIFVTQTPDYILPATSCLLQHRLQLSSSCYSLDISLGCSGWVYAFSVLASLMSAGKLKKGLLLAGETMSKISYRKDKSVYPLFGDAGTAFALEYSEGLSDSLQFQFSTDGSGCDAIIIPDGGYRSPFTVDSLKEQVTEGIVRNNLSVGLDGMDVFSFGISKAPEIVNSLLDNYQIEKDSIDYFIFHQANLFMNEKIRKKLKLPVEKVPYSLKDFGNTSSASIPLTLTSQLSQKLANEKLNMLACGFGVGLSWGAVHFVTDHIVCSNLIEI